MSNGIGEWDLVEITEIFSDTDLSSTARFQLFSCPDSYRDRETI